ncbi:maleylpyruvate isomerase family mycothiol-dependent enzyme [Nocardia sp. NPDC055321]
MDRETSWQVIEQQRLAIADMLADLTPEQWDTPSLCAGWRVREVAAHVAFTPTPPAAKVMLATAIRTRGNYNRFIDTLTREQAAIAGDPVAALRANAAVRTLPRLTNYRNILFDTIVHGQDMAIPLGRTLIVTPAGAAAGADRAVEVGRPVWDPHRLDGLHLTATDIEWSHGVGAEVCGPVLALLLLITGRPVALTMVEGPGVSVLAQRLGTSLPTSAHTDDRE